MRTPANSWPTTEAAEGALFFAQQMREMLLPTTFESFRVLSLDTVTRLRETLNVIVDILQDRIPPTAGDAFYDELKWSLEVDPVIPKIEPEISKIICQMIGGKGRSANALMPYVNSLLKRVIDKFGNETEERILGLIPNSGRRNDLRVLTGFYCSRLLNLGYTKRHVLDLVNEHFFKRDVKKAGAPMVRAFFRKLDGKRVTFTTFTVVNLDFARSMNRVSREISEYSELPEHVRDAFGVYSPSEKDYRFLKTDVEALDEYGAADRVERILTYMQAMNYLGPQYEGYWWDSERFIQRRRATRGRLLRPSLMSVGRTRTIGSSVKGLQSTFRDIMNQLNDGSRRRLLASLNTSGIYRGASSADGQLISLWSAVEVLFGDPPEDTSRVSHYANKFIPCVSIRYLRRMISAVTEDFQLEYRQRFVRIIREEEDFADSELLVRFSAVMMLEKNDALRTKLLELCAENPLARHRLMKLWNDCKSPDVLGRALEAHDKRLRWHIFRIYRVRNQLVHNGLHPSYLNPVAENLLEYYKESVRNILRFSRMESGRGSELLEVVDEIGVEYQIYKSFVQSLRGQKFDVGSMAKCMFVLET
jgi:hypothetical protein